MLRRPNRSDPVASPAAGPARRRRAAQGDDLGALAAGQIVYVSVPILDQQGAVIDLRMADPVGADGAPFVDPDHVTGQLGSTVFEDVPAMLAAADLAWREGARPTFETRRRSQDEFGLAVADCEVTTMRVGDRLVHFCHDRSVGQMVSPSVSILGSVIDESDIGMMLFRPELDGDVITGVRIEWFNDAARRLWGESIMTLPDLLDPAEGGSMLTRLAQEAWSEGTVNRLREVPATANRPAMTISQTLQRVGDALLEIAVDLTEEIEIQQAMRRLETRFGETLDTVTDVVFVVNPVVAADGESLAAVELLYLNAEARRVFGLGPEAALPEGLAVDLAALGIGAVAVQAIERASRGERVEHLFGGTTDVQYPRLAHLSLGHVTYTPAADGAVLIVVRDLSQLHQAQGQVERAIEFEEMVLDAFAEPAMILEPDEDGVPMVVACNTEAVTWLPAPMPCSVRLWPYPDAAVDIEAGARLAIEHNRPSRSTLVIQEDVVPVGEVVAARLVHSPLSGRRSLLVLHDVSSEVNEGRRYRKEARQDPESHLLNSMGFLEAVEEMFTATPPAAVLAVRIDQFERLENALGPAAAGVVLEGIVERVRRVAPPGAVIGRLRFMTLGLALPASVSRDEAMEAAFVLTAAVTQPVRVGVHSIHVDGHAGVVFVDPGMHTVGDAHFLIQQSRSAAGKAQFLHHRVVEWSDDMPLGDPFQLDLLGGVRRAIEQGELFVVYQPVIRADGSLLGVEALVRWDHPVHGRLRPDSFIELVEASTLVLPFTMEVLRRSIAGFQESRLPGTCTVNVPATLLSDPALVPLVQEVLAETGFDPNRLCLEATERAMLSAIEFAVSNIEQLRALGVAVAVDDFGIGSTSLMQLERFRFTTVKIDRQVIAGIDRDRVKQTIVSSMVRIGDELGVTVIAEGIETADEIATCRSLGVHALQGYSLQPPAPIAQWAEVFRPV